MRNVGLQCLYSNLIVYLPSLVTYSCHEDGLVSLIKAVAEEPALKLLTALSTSL